MNPAQRSYKPGRMDGTVLSHRKRQRIDSVLTASTKGNEATNPRPQPRQKKSSSATGAASFKSDRLGPRGPRRAAAGHSSHSFSELLAELNDAKAAAQEYQTRIAALEGDLAVKSAAEAELQQALESIATEKSTLEDKLSAALSRIAALEAALRAKEADVQALLEDLKEQTQLRRKLHNQVMELKGNIRVFCRVRPFLEEELKEEEKALEGAQPAVASAQASVKARGVVRGDGPSKLFSRSSLALSPVKPKASLLSVNASEEGGVWDSHSIQVGEEADRELEEALGLDAAPPAAAAKAKPSALARTPLGVSYPTHDPEQKSLALRQPPVKGFDGSWRLGNSSNFEFDRVFRPSATQTDCFEEVSQLVQSAVDGYNVCIFAYGCTNSGKTFTIEGNMEDSTADGAPGAEAGILPRAVHLIYREIARLQREGWRYRVRASQVEVFNEQLLDLLAPTGADAKPLDIALSKDRETYVKGLKRVECDSTQRVLELVQHAAKSRKVAATQCNERSSRSHTVFELAIDGDFVQSSDASTERLIESRRGRLLLIDLAGSERIKASEVTGERLKETKHINKSLSCLGDVIAALSSGAGHVPFRNSKLTHLLQDAMSGDSKVLMFLNISPAVSTLGETLRSLEFGSKVNQCSVKKSSKGGGKAGKK